MEKELPISEKEKLMYQLVDEEDKNFKYKVSLAPMLMNLEDECDREQMVSFYQMYPLVQRSVSIQNADYIVYGHPFARVSDFTDDVLHDLEYIDKERNQGSEIIIVGKAVNIAPYIKNKYDNVTYVGSHFTEYLGKRFGLDIKEEYFVYDDRDERNELNIWPVDGCLNKCGFCRRTYMNIPFESLSLDYIKKHLDLYRENHPEQMRFINLRAENLTEYGIDIYGEQKLHELIDLVDSYEEVEKIGFPIGMNIGEITPIILEALCKSKKIASIGLNLEAGSNRLLNLIGKKHSREYAMYVYNALREAHPDLLIDSTIMIGLPTEELEDIVELADLINKCEPNSVRCNYYGYSPKHPIAKYLQLDKGKKEYHLKFLMKLLKENDDRYRFLRFSYEAPFRKNHRTDGREKRKIEEEQKYVIPRLLYEKCLWFCDEGITVSGDFSWDKYFQKINIYKAQNPKRYKQIVKKHNKN